MFAINVGIVMTRNIEAITKVFLIFISKIETCDFIVIAQSYANHLRGERSMVTILDCLGASTYVILVIIVLSMLWF